MSRVKEFSFSRDRDLIMWKETLLYNGMRAAAAGPVLAMILLLAGEPAGEALPAIFLWPLGYFVFLLPMGALFLWMSSFFPFVSIAAAFVGLMVAVGDPLVYILHKLRPEVVPTEQPHFFSLHVISFVLLPFDE